MLWDPGDIFLRFEKWRFSKINIVSSVLGRKEAQTVAVLIKMTMSHACRSAQLHVVNTKTVQFFSLPYSQHNMAELHCLLLSQVQKRFLVTCLLYLYHNNVQSPLASLKYAEFQGTIFAVSWPFILKNDGMFSIIPKLAGAQWHDLVSLQGGFRCTLHTELQRSSESFCSQVSQRGNNGKEICIFTSSEVKDISNGTSSFLVAPNESVRDTFLSKLIALRAIVNYQQIPAIICADIFFLFPLPRILGSQLRDVTVSCSNCEKT